MIGYSACLGLPTPRWVATDFNSQSQAFGSFRGPLGSSWTLASPRLLDSLDSPAPKKGAMASTSKLAPEAFQILAGILSLGNCEFGEAEDGEERGGGLVVGQDYWDPILG